MELLFLNERNAEILLPRTFTFVRKYRSGRITPRALKLFRTFQPSSLGEPGKVVLVAITPKRKLVGVLACADYGRQFSLIVIRPDLRARGLGTMMLQAAIERLGQFYAIVAADNIPSLKMCFRCGLWAYDVYLSEYGKPTLRLMYRESQFLEQVVQ